MSALPELPMKDIRWIPYSDVERDTIRNLHERLLARSDLTAEEDRTLSLLWSSFDFARKATHS